MLMAREQGDTLIEVIFATAVLSLIIVIALSVMNAGTAQAERAVEGTFVRQGIDSQTAMLRFARDAYVDKEAGADALWAAQSNSILSQRSSSTLNFSQLATTQPNCKPTNNKAFWLDDQGGAVTVNTSFTTPTTYAAPGHGMWIEATPTGTTNYVDFYIYACWSAPNGNGNSTSGTVVRLYAPAS